MSYADCLVYAGITENQAQLDMNNNVIIDTIHNRQGLILCASDIHGLGVFLSEDSRAERCWMAAKGNTKYLCGRFINHSDNPNCKFVFSGNTVFCVLLKDLVVMTELTVSYLDNMQRIKRRRDV